MAHFAIRIGLYYGVFDGDDDYEAMDNALAHVKLDHIDLDDLRTHKATDYSIRPATVREALAHEYGKDWATPDYRRNSLSHLVDVYWNEEGYTSLNPSQIVINHTMSRDVHGYAEAIGIGNYRVLRDQWSEYEALTDGPYSGSTHIGLELDKEAPADLIEVLESLDKYPVLDDQAHSEAESEIIEEHWKDYGAWDLHNAVAKAIGADELTQDAKDLIWTLVWEGVLSYGCGGGYPAMIDSSMCDFGTEEITAWIKARLGLVVPIHTHNGHGSVRNVFLNRANLVAA